MSEDLNRAEYDRTMFVRVSPEPTWVGWGWELQAIAQTGLRFSESEYDRERYRKILKISTEIFANYSGESPALIRGLFENHNGYATPKVDVRGVVFRVRTKPDFEFEELVSRKSLDLAGRSDLFASKPNEKVTTPIRWRNTGRQYWPEPRGLVP
jgi:hypothetical protein